MAFHSDATSASGLNSLSTRQDAARTQFYAMADYILDLENGQERWREIEINVTAGSAWGYDNPQRRFGRARQEEARCLSRNATRGTQPKAGSSKGVYKEQWAGAPASGRLSSVLTGRPAPLL